MELTHKLRGYLASVKEHVEDFHFWNALPWAFQEVLTIFYEVNARLLKYFWVPKTFLVPENLGFFFYSLRNAATFETERKVTATGRFVSLVNFQQIINVLGISESQIWDFGMIKFYPKSWKPRNEILVVVCNFTFFLVSIFLAWKSYLLLNLLEYFVLRLLKDCLFLYI